MSNYQPGQDRERADLWRDFQKRFMQLAREEQGRADVITERAVLQRMDQVLRAVCDYKKHPEGWERGKPEQGMICLLDTPAHGVWNYSFDGVSENFRERVRLCIAEAGRAQPDYPQGADPEDVWLHRLYLDLRENESDLLFADSREGGMILSVCVASATFCARLERRALQESPKAGASNAREALLKPMLQAKGFSVHDWAQRANVDFHTAQDYLKGTTSPYPSTLKKLADALGVKVEDLPA